MCDITDAQKPSSPAVFNPLSLSDDFKMQLCPEHPCSLSTGGTVLKGPGDIYRSSNKGGRGYWVVLEEEAVVQSYQVYWIVLEYV